MKHIKKAIDWFIHDVIDFEDDDSELEMMEEDMYMSWMEMDDSQSQENRFNKNEMSIDTYYK